MNLHQHGCRIRRRHHLLKLQTILNLKLLDSRLVSFYRRIKFFKHDPNWLWRVLKVFDFKVLAWSDRDLEWARFRRYVCKIIYCKGRRRPRRTVVHFWRRRRTPLTINVAQIKRQWSIESKGRAIEQPSGEVFYIKSEWRGWLKAHLHDDECAMFSR